MVAAYAPPSFRNRTNNSTSNNNNQQPPPLAKKTALKKQHVDINSNVAFPSIGDTLKNTKNAKGGGTPMSFSSMASKRLAEPVIEKIVDVPPGWVHIRKHKGVIQYKYGAPVPLYYDESRDELILGRILFKHRLAREQYERDRDIEHLGDLSEFYGEPSLAEIYENDNKIELEKSYYNGGDSISEDSDMDGR